MPWRARLNNMSLHTRRGVTFGLSCALMAVVVMLPPLLRPERTWYDAIGLVVGVLWMGIVGGLLGRWSSSHAERRRRRRRSRR